MLLFLSKEPILFNTVFKLYVHFTMQNRAATKRYEVNEVVRVDSIKDCTEIIHVLWCSLEVKILLIIIDEFQFCCIALFAWSDTQSQKHLSSLGVHASDMLNCHSFYTHT